MNLDKTAKTLKKINRLYELISDIGESTDTERDLLKAYAKDLYNSLSVSVDSPISLINSYNRLIFFKVFAVLSKFIIILY